MSPAVLVGTQISLGCGDGWVFSHDWYQRPAIKLTCQASGLFDIPETGWPLCVDRKLSDFVYIYQQNCNFFYFLAIPTTTPCPNPNGCSKNFLIQSLSEKVWESQCKLSLNLSSTFPRCSIVFQGK